MMVNAYFFLTAARAIERASLVLVLMLAW